MGSNIDVVRRQIALVKQATVSPEAFAKMHARIAREEIAKLEAKQGAYPRTTVVDGRRDTSEDAVKAGGVIQYEISPVGDVVDEVYRALVLRSPVGPAKGGHYRDDHRLYVNGRRRDAGEGQAIEIKPGDEVIVINVRPYARKIEGARMRGGKTRAGLSAQAPNGVYEITAREMKARYSNYPVKIEFDYRAVLDGSAPMAPAPSLSEQKRMRRGRGHVQNKSENRYPCIVITVDR